MSYQIRGLDVYDCDPIDKMGEEEDSLLKEEEEDLLAPPGALGGVTV